MTARMLAVTGLVLFGFAACADPGTSVPSRTANPTAAQKAGDRLDAARAAAEPQGPPTHRARNPERP